MDGNTDGYFLNKSTTHTKYEQGAWWQVDLGGQKNIKQIIIYNRTDCCADRLSNYQVSISDKADFSTHTYHKTFMSRLTLKNHSIRRIRQTRSLC
ncbi:hypothetical protein BSPWISOXPB_6546 [uncultured Gammaproteobacteria bacterium]|nr:hypothetical protein BSPWISOXPB_6546 [uncultured Gammaproteobacteria bacterium]